MIRINMHLNDVWAGLTGAAVALPQAMAFGVALFAPHGIGAAQGALAGLTGAVCLLLASGLLGGTVGLISSPTGPTLALLSGALTVLAAGGVAEPTLPVALIAVTAASGLAQMLIAVSGGSRLIKFIPYPVVAGFSTGAALLMIKSQVKPLTGAGADTLWANWRWLPAVVALATFLLVRYAPRLLPRIPGAIIGLLGGTLLFQLLIQLGPGAVPAAWVVGALPSVLNLQLPLQPTGWEALPWPLVLQSALALAMLASMNTLLASVIADATTGLRHNGRRELLAQGLGQCAAGLMGGMAGSATTGATVVAVQAGGRRWTGIIAGAALALLALGAGPVGQWLPTSALAGILIAAALGLVETDILAWARRPTTQLDAAVAVLVAAVTVSYDLTIAVLVGVAIAIILFIHAQVKTPVIHRRLTEQEKHSVRVHPPEQAELLAGHGDRIILYELRGALFFAKADQLFEDMLLDIDHPAWVILNLRRVFQIDLTAIKLLEQIAARLKAHGGELLFCEVHSGLGIGHCFEHTLSRLSLAPALPAIKTFNGSDEALEYAENALLADLGMALTTPQDRVTLADMNLCCGMNATEQAALANVVRCRLLRIGEQLFAAGDSGDELYVVLRGEIEIRLPTSPHHYKRLGIYGPGTLFGDVAFLDPGPRTADGIATQDSELLALDQAGFKQLQAQNPAAAIALLRAIGRHQSRALRWSSREIRQLAQW
ncbi:MAG: SulP family inorganic anion transporter [Candidatus Competibacteraceae bacterium]